MSDKHINHLDVENLYRQSSTEMPSKNTDDAILQFAAAQLASQPKQPVSSKQETSNEQSASSGKSNTVKPAVSWRKWQWPMSIAASVVFVAVLFSHYSMFSNPALMENPQQQSQAPQDILEDALYQTSESKVQLRQRKALDPNPQATTALRVSKLVAVNSHVVADEHTDQGASFNEDLPQHLQSMKGSLPIDDLLIADAMPETMAFDDATSTSTNEPQVQLFEQENLEQIVVTGNQTIPSLDAELLDYDYLDSLVAIITNTPQPSTAVNNAKLGVIAKPKAPASSDSGIHQKDSPLSSAQARIALSKYLQNWQKYHPAAEIPKKYQVYLKGEQDN